MARVGKHKQILLALEEVCRDRRFHEVTLEDVASQAGVGKGTIYRYFRDKEDLFKQLVAFGMDKLCASLQQHVAAEGDFTQKLTGMCQTISDFFISRATLIRMAGEQEMRCHALSPEDRKAHEDNRKRLDAILVLVLREGRAQGLLRDDIPAEIAARLLMALLRERNVTFANDPRQPDVATVVELFLNGFAGFGGLNASGVDAAATAHAQGAQSIAPSEIGEGVSADADSPKVRDARKYCVTPDEMDEAEDGD